MQSVILTIFNKQNILKMILESLIQHTSKTVDEYIFVLDGCTDNSESILNDFLVKTPGINYKIIKTNDVFELRANNAGLKACKNEYAIIVQDDMCIKESNWNDRLMMPIKTFDDIWAVTARAAVSLDVNDRWYNIKEGPVGHRFSTDSNYPRNVVHVGQIVNRGPLLLKMSVMKSINYFDESLPGCIGCDDADACLKVYERFKLRCCSYWISYYSPLEWGATRSGPNVSYVANEETKNRHEVIARYRTLLTSWDKDETRYLSQ